MLILIGPIWLILLIWLIWYSARRQQRYEATKALAAQRELQTVAALTEAMKEEYRRRKAEGGRDLARVKPPSKFPMVLLWWLFIFGPLLWAFWMVWGAQLFGGNG
jgi:type VI protein secretion system component VasK